MTSVYFPGNPVRAGVVAADADPRGAVPGLRPVDGLVRPDEREVAPDVGPREVRRIIEAPKPHRRAARGSRAAHKE